MGPAEVNPGSNDDPRPRAKSGVTQDDGLSAARHLLDRKGTIVETLECVKCRYELRGLPSDGHCPECGLPIATTIANLEFGERPMFHRGQPLSGHERRRAIRALTVLTAFMAGTWISAIVSTGVLILAAAESRHSGFQWVVMVVVPTLAALRTGRLMGSWMLSGTAGRGETGAARTFACRSLRASVIAQAIAMWLPIGVWLWSSISSMRAGAMLSDGGYVLSSTLVAAAIGVTMIAVCFDFFATMNLVGPIAARVPATELAMRAGQYIYLLPTMAVVFTAIPIGGPLIAMILYWILLVDVRSALKDERIADRLERSFIQI